MNEVKKKGAIDSFLNFVEKVGNKLPHPATLFGILALAMIIISGIGSKMGWGVEFTSIDRVTKETVDKTVVVKSLMSKEGVTYIFTSMVKNFTGFAPLGTVLVAMIGIGVCERSGLMGTLIKRLVTSTPRKLITIVVVFLGIMSNVASDAGYVVLPPLAAIIFMSYGRHPLAGLAAAFAGVSGGFSANLLIGSIDPLLGGISTEATKLAVDGGLEVLPTANYYFMFVSTFIIAIVGTFVTEKIVEPRLGKYEGDLATEANYDVLTDNEKKGLKAAGVSLIPLAAFLGLVYYMIGSKNFLGHGLVPIFVFFFAVPGFAYGRATGTVKGDKDLIKMMTASFEAMAGYIVLVFFAAQFIAYFNYTNVGTILAVEGANFLEAAGITGIPLIIGFVLVVCFLNLFMGSASAKWAILAPVFIPMFMRVGYSPEFTQLAYRIGDSTTNIISPLMSYFAMIIVFMQKYDKKASLGTLISTMLPYSIAFLIFWSILLIIWMLLGLPIGPGAAMTFTM